MTENEAITYLGYFKNWNNDDRWLSDETMEEFVKCCVEALKEIQKYREVGTVEEIKTAKKYIALKKECGTPTNTIDVCAEYVAIGTVEECREAVEKQKAKKCDVKKDNFRIYYKCPTCNHCLRVEYNHGSWMGKKSKNCSKCGQAIRWENLGEMEDERD